MDRYDPNSIDSSFTKVMLKLEEQDRERHELRKMVREVKDMLQDLSNRSLIQERDILQLKEDVLEVVKKVEPIYSAAIKATTIAGAIYFVIMVFSDVIRNWIMKIWNHLP